MCHRALSSPPAVPRALLSPDPGGGSAAAVPGGGDGVEGRDLVLESRDGTRLGAHAAPAPSPGGPGVVILPDARGLHDFYRQLAARFAGAGVHAVAIDLFARTAGMGERSEGFDPRPHMEQLTAEAVAADVAAAVEHLRSVAGGGATSIFTVGFCLGGGYSWRQSADTPGLAGCAGFYGRPPVAAEVVGRMRAPLLILAAGADHMPPAESEALAQEAGAAGIDVERTVYEGAPHSFFDRRFDEHREACADAWQRVLGFIRSRAS